MSTSEQLIFPASSIPSHLLRFFEPSLCYSCYTCHTLTFLREIRRVLRPDGVLFWNCGDSYSGSGGAGEWSKRKAGKQEYAGPQGDNPNRYSSNGLKPKDLCLIPFRVALAAQADGWWVRSVIIWSKNNPMPESVRGSRWEQHRKKVVPSARADKGAHIEAYGDSPQGARDGREFADHASEYADCPGCAVCLPNGGLVLRYGSGRPTESHEYILMLTKSARYYWDQEAVRERANPETQRGKAVNSGIADGNIFNGDRRQNYEKDRHIVEARNLRSVWSFPSQPYPEAHFATFPEELPERCIKAATPEMGSCAMCGKPWVVEDKYIQHRKPWKDTKHPNGRNTEQLASWAAQYGSATKTPQTLGWKPQCDCGVETVPSLCLDPFMGSGTTLWVAKKLGRRAVGYDISAEYCQLALERNRQMGLV